jgi:hypothetical protein
LLLLWLLLFLLLLLLLLMLLLRLMMSFSATTIIAPGSLRMALLAPPLRDILEPSHELLIYHQR